MLTFAATSTVPATERPAYADSIRALYVQTPASLVGNAVGLALVAFSFWPLAPQSRLLAWLGLGALLWLARLAHYLRFRRRPQAEDGVLQGWRSSWVATSKGVEVTSFVVGRTREA